MLNKNQLIVTQGLIISVLFVYAVVFTTTSDNISKATPNKPAAHEIERVGSKQLCESVPVDTSVVLNCGDGSSVLLVKSPATHPDKP